MYWSFITASGRAESEWQSRAFLARDIHTHTPTANQKEERHSAWIYRRAQYIKRSYNWPKKRKENDKITVKILHKQTSFLSFCKSDLNCKLKKD